VQFFQGQHFSLPREKHSQNRIGSAIMDVLSIILHIEFPIYKT
jgi:hypothetical protein